MGAISVETGAEIVRGPDGVYLFGSDRDEGLVMSVGPGGDEAVILMQAVLGDLPAGKESGTLRGLLQANAVLAGMGAGIGMGMGMAMAQQMANQGPWGARPAAAPAAPQAAAVPPPPPPVEHVWHVAENGETRGPFSKAAMGRMAAAGEITRDTHVWTAGQDGWKRAEDVAELAQLFTILPPPPPGT